ncbi:hypothetical protein KCU86_g6990, partial [Aureobasidium melanogenum]
MTDDRSGQILGVAIAFLIPTAISTALRVYTRTKVLRSQAGRDDVAMVLAFALYLIYLVCQLSGVAHGSGKKRYLIDDHTAQKGLMVSRISTYGTNQPRILMFQRNSTGSSAKFPIPSLPQPSKSASAFSCFASPSTALTSGSSAGL